GAARRRAADAGRLASRQRRHGQSPVAHQLPPIVVEYPSVSQEHRRMTNDTQRTHRETRTMVTRALILLAALAGPLAAQGRAEVTPRDTSARPENITSSRDGTV